MAIADDLNLGKYIRCIPDFPKPGILFRDVTPLLGNAAALRYAVTKMADAFRDQQIDIVAAAEARGFIFASPVALELNAALVPIRKPGKLPYETLAHSYVLEYGNDTLEIHKDAVPQGARVLMVDDLLATGGTVEACCRLVEKAGGVIAGCSFLIELTGFKGARKIADYPVVSLIKFP
ncbi:MAG: adenine phosphoribosyltransferase [Thermoguttaceae bacterium]